jgi:hypothetical protein
MLAVSGEKLKVTGESMLDDGCLIERFISKRI